MSTPPASAPGPRLLSTPTKRTESADVIAAIEVYKQAAESWGLHLEGEGHDLARADYDAASQTLADALCSFLDWREPVKRFVRYQGCLWTCPEAGTGGYGDDHIVCFDPADVGQFTVDLDASEG
ncbi:hypothetical protein [Paludisphaera rhizosphaerae]|uniref:hypothetical protein n=1 Tax=Paludisphaera rhizosphaerae TaxID=2711216 RepID=UPI0013EAADB7|nr:hypothetical protein [Paludisphaera rhizosphaerae]